MEYNMTKSWMLCFCFLSAMVVMFVPEIVFAQGAGAGGAAISKVLCNAVKLINGQTGKALATLAVIVIGIGALMGKVSWGMAIIVGIGIAVIFGAGAIVDEVSGAAGQNC